jgi:hypothetical protein
MRLQICFLFVIAGCLSCSDRAGAKPLVITRGGTYSGGEYDAIAVNTADLVTIENLSLRGSSHLITSHYQHAKVTIRNVRAVGVRPEVAGRAVGRFAHLEGFDHVVIENCSLETTAGIYLLDYAGDRSASNTVRVVANRARNIDGRKSDGKGGYQPGGEGASELVQFVQLDKVRGVSGAEIAWNEVINEPGKSRVEDVVSVYLSSGTNSSPIKIYGNFIRGAYAADPAKEPFSGGGIMLGDGVAKESPDGDPGFVHAFDNVVLDTTNYGIAISAGHDCQIYRNRILSAGVLPDGRRIAGQNVGAYVWDSYKSGERRFYNNSGSDNLIGWYNDKPARNDWWRPHATKWENNANWPEPITPAMYESEYERWRAKVKSAGITVGPR